MKMNLNNDQFITKIAVFPGVFLNGGVEYVVEEIFNSMKNKNIVYDIYVSRNYEGPKDKQLIAKGVRIFYIPEMKNLNPLKYIRLIRKMLKSNGKYDYIHVHSIHSGVLNSVAGYFAGINNRIYHVHNTSDPLLKGLRFPRLFRFISTRMIKMFNNKYIACGKDAAIYIYGSKLVMKKVLILKNAINLDIFKPIHTTKYREFALDRNDNTVFIGNAARFTEVKNQRFLIELIYEANLNGDYRLLLAGDGELRDSYEKLVSELNINDKVYFLGNITDMNLFYNSLDVFILPSLHEGLPLSLVESQSCGIPSIASENITEEVDMGLNLMTRINLTENKIKWINQIDRVISVEKLKSEEIAKVIRDNKYDLDSFKDQVLTIYKLKVEGAKHESK